jgi:hypothetical protein
VGLVFAIFGYSLINNTKIIDKKTFNPSNDAQGKLKLMQEIQEVWSGNSDFICDEFKNLNAVNAEFFNCNPNYLKCYLKSKQFKFSMKFDRRKNPIINLISNAQKMKLKLLDTCSDTYLPQRKYSAGPKGINLIWDNINQNIFIDKNYVSNLDVSLWSGKEYKNVFKPNIDLSREERIGFCQSKGKQLLESRYFDAASFYIGSLDKNPIHIFKYPFPWTKKRSLNLKIPKSRDCANIYSRECENIRPYEFYEPIATTWIGINNSLGSYPEVFINKFIPKANLKVSSFNFPFKSKWHQVGLRAYYDGSKSNFIESYLDREIDNDRIENIGVAFRCMLNR